jgi:hypothetical protein
VLADNEVGQIIGLVLIRLGLQVVGYTVWVTPMMWHNAAPETYRETGSSSAD